MSQKRCEIEDWLQLDHQYRKPSNSYSHVNSRGGLCTSTAFLCYFSAQACSIIVLSPLAVNLNDLWQSLWLELLQRSVLSSATGLDSHWHRAVLCSAHDFVLVPDKSQINHSILSRCSAVNRLDYMADVQTADARDRCPFIRCCFPANLHLLMWTAVRCS